MTRFLCLTVVAAGLLSPGLFGGTAQACPSCKNANATDTRLPLAYQASILFMLSVPAVMCSALGFGLYRLNKAQVAAMEAFENGDVWQAGVDGSADAYPGAQAVLPAVPPTRLAVTGVGL